MGQSPQTLGKLRWGFVTDGVIEYCELWVSIGVIVIFGRGRTFCKGDSLLCDLDNISGAVCTTGFLTLKHFYGDTSRHCKGFYYCFIY